MKDNIKSISLHYNIDFEFDSNGKQLNQIIKEHFLIYLKELQKEKKEQELVRT